MPDKTNIGSAVSREVAAGLECKKARILCVGYDNGRTPGSSWNNAGSAPNFIRFNWPMELKSFDYNGVKQLGEGEPFGPYSGWTPQLQGWSSTINQLTDNQKKLNAAFGFLPAPTWRYTKITTVDPCVKIGLIHACRTDIAAPNNEYWIAPAQELTVETIVTAFCRQVADSKTGEVSTEWFTKEVVDGEEVFVEGGQPTWQPTEGGAVVPIPEDCFIPCNQKFEPWLVEGAESPCETQEFDLCDFLEDGTSVEVKLYIHDCDGVRTRELYTQDQIVNSPDPLDPDSDQHEIQGEIKNCDGSAFVEPPPSDEKKTQVEVCPVKEITTDQLTMCAFLDGDLNNCSDENIKDFVRVFENCITDGKLSNRTFTDFEPDGITPLNDESFTEETVSLECRIADDGSVIVCRDTCYTYSPPIIVKPIRVVKSVKTLVASIKLQAVKTLVKPLSIGRREPIVARAITDSEEVLPPSKWVRGTCLTVKHCCKCGDPENVVSQEFWIRGPDEIEFKQVDPFSVNANWIEKPCDPALDCPTEDKVDLGDCSIAAIKDAAACALEPFKVTKSTAEGNQDGAIQITIGRPNNAVPWKLIDNRDPNNQVTVVEGATFSEFNINAQAAGFTSFIVGEAHYFCPCPVGLDQAGDYFVTADGDTVTKPACTPLAELEGAPEKVAEAEQCALRATLCESDIQKLAKAISEEECQIVERCILVGGIKRDALVSINVKTLEVEKTFDTVSCQEVANPVFVDCCRTLEDGSVVKNAGSSGAVLGDFSNESTLTVNNSDGTSSQVTITNAQFDEVSGTTSFQTATTSQAVSVKAVKFVRS